MKAKFIQKGDAVDICPTADLEAGEIVRLGNLIGITRLPIKAGALGTITLTGVFELTKSQTVSFQAGDNVFWDPQNATPAKSGILLGIALGETATTVRVLLNCSANETTASGEAACWQLL